MLQHQICTGLPRGLVQACAWAPSCQHVAVAFSSVSHAGTLLVFNTQLEQQLDLPHLATSVAWAPCSSVLGFTSGGRLHRATLPAATSTHSSAYAAQLAALQAQVGNQAVHQISWSLHGACMVAGETLLLVSHSPALPHQAARVSIEQYNDAQLQQASLSPDGTCVVYVVRERGLHRSSSVVWVLQQQQGPQVLQVGGSEADKTPLACCWHPSNKFIAVLTTDHDLLVCRPFGSVLKWAHLDTWEAAVYWQQCSSCLAWSHTGCELRVNLDKGRAVVLTFASQPANYSKATRRIASAPLVTMTAWQAVGRLLMPILHVLCYTPVYIGLNLLLLAVLMWNLGRAERNRL